jgi:hypothetical protein
MPRNLFSSAPLRFSIGDLSSAIGKWSRIATFGAKSKDGADMVFDASTLGQMVDNVAARGDKIAICQDHLSAFVSQTGQPAPALGFFTALAVVAGGRVVKAWNGQPEPSALDDGLYAQLGEITPRGADPRDGLANYSFLSPMFSNKGTDEAGDDIGFALYDVAATNTPFQAGTEIQFNQANAAPGREQGALVDDKEMAKRFGFEDGDDDAKKAEKMAKFWADHDAMAKKMSDAENAVGKAVMDAKDGDPDKDGDKDKKMSAELAATKASHAAMMSRLAALEAADKARKDAEAAEQTRKVESLADAAVAGGYPKESRDVLVTFARSNFEAAKALVSPHLKGAPAHLFARVSQSGAPIGAPADAGSARGSGHRPITMSQTPLGTAIAPDEEFADEIQRVAMSKDPGEIEKVNKHLNVAEQSQPWARLVAAERVIRKERPDLVERAARVAAGIA